MQARELAQAIGLLALLALALSAVPAQMLLRNSRRLHLVMGMLSGMAAATSMAMPALQSVLEPISRVAPVTTAVVMLVFGPVAGLLSAFVVVCVHSLLHPALASTGLVLVLGTTALAYAWHWVRARGYRVAALLAMALTLPLVLELCLQVWDFLPVDEGVRHLPWRFGAGVLLLGGAVELLMRRAQTARALHEAHAALQQRE